ncbi:MAG: isopentenyl transferase family protein, partial [Alistipes sp.]|nr:isopentenyl transferase family protein [Alistipes sp.]
MLSRRLLRIKVIKSLYAHLKSGSTNLMASEKTLMQSVDKCYDLYFLMMSVIVDIARYAESRQELAKQKQLPTHEDLNPNRRFVDNRVIHLIATSDSINDRLAARKLSWSQQGDLIKDLYNKLIKTDFYKAYMTSSEDSFAADLKFVDQFFREALENDEQLESTLDDMSLLWNDDLGFALIMVVRTLSGIRESATEIKTLPKFKSDEDEEFVKRLFEKSLLQYNDNQTIMT